MFRFLFKNDSANISWPRLLACLTGSLVLSLCVYRFVVPAVDYWDLPTGISRPISGVLILPLFFAGVTFVFIWKAVKNYFTDRRSCRAIEKSIARHVRKSRN